jgi:putative ABC transport system substrate-binding protein
MMRKEIIVALLAIFSSAAICTVGAQQPTKIPTVGFLVVAPRSFFTDRIESFRQGLQSLGYIEGKAINIEYRYAEGKLDRLPELAKELVAANVDVIVTTSRPGILAVKSATRTIPIVFSGVQDPVAMGLIDSLARPGGNATGLSILAPELGGKRLEILKETVPRVVRVAFFLGPSQGVGGDAVEATRSAARGLGLQLKPLNVRDSKDLDKAFETAIAEKVQCILTNPSPVINTHRLRIVELATKNRLPGMYAAPEFVEAGGLMSYTPSYTEQFRRAAVYVDKILKGAKPADLPVEQPMKFEFVVNLKTAKQIGLTIPQWTLMKADRVIR